MCSTCPAPVMARRNDSRSMRSPTAISDAPACWSEAPASGRRTKARTFPPFLAMAATTRWPVLPDAPVTRIGWLSSISCSNHGARNIARIGLCGVAMA